MNRSPFQRITALALAVLIVGAAGAESLRSCPHHGEMEGHGFTFVHGSDASSGHGDRGRISSKVHPGGVGATLDASGEGASAPLHDPGPCDHNLGVCETVTAGLVLPSNMAGLLPRLGPVEWIISDPREAAPSADPSFLLPYSIGPPHHG